MVIHPMALTPVKSAHVKVTATTLKLGGDEFYLQSLCKRRIPLRDAVESARMIIDPTTAAYLPATAIGWTKDRFTHDELDKIALNFMNQDDVWNMKFLRVIILRVNPIRKVLIDPGVIAVVTDATFEQLPDGPYMVQTLTGETFPVSRMFEDNFQAFIGGTIAKPKHTTKSFKWMRVEDRIAVPSRLYGGFNESKPLAGLRFAVKDIIDVAGLETGCGNRHFRSIQYPEKCSAPCIQQLINAGAVLVGKTKTTQFAVGQNPGQWCDYLAPFNPRGDMYQNPSSSSTGSAVASAAYPWLDFTVGTDTGGSIRHPAGVCGTYGFRPSMGAISGSRVFSVAPYFDTVGVFARSPSLMEAATRVMMDPSVDQADLAPPKKYKLLYPFRAKDEPSQNSHRWFPNLDGSTGDVGEAISAQWKFENVIEQLEKHLRCSRTVFNFEDLWRDTHPEGQSEDLDKATGHIYSILTTFSVVREQIDPFIDMYQDRNNGKIPFIDPIVKARLDFGRKLRPTQAVDATQSADMFSKWVKEVLFETADIKTELPLLIFPQSWGRPEYRDTPKPGEDFLSFSTFSTYSLSYLSGCPDCTMPVGEVPYFSRVTKREEYLPISLSILSPPGTDRTLLALLTELEAEGILKEVVTGPRSYAPTLKQPSSSPDTLSGDDVDKR